jgi:trk system potassium uptake protein TrkA
LLSEFVVIGLGRFGQSLALNLSRAGHSVLAIDPDERVVAELAADLDAVVAADATDEAALRELNVDRMGTAVVAIGMDSMQASILTTALLRQLGVPRIVARSLSPLHSRVLVAVGAHTVVNPEEEVGRRLARRLSEPSVLKRYELSGDTSLAEIELPASFVDKTVTDLDVRAKFGVTVLAVRRNDDIVAITTGAESFRENDVLVVIGPDEGVRRLSEVS